MRFLHLCNLSKLCMGPLILSFANIFIMEGASAQNAKKIVLLFRKAR
jgi:hypothetical protein